MALDAPPDPAPPSAGERQKLGLLGWIVIGTVSALAAGGFAVVYVFSAQRPGIASQTTTYNVVDDASVTVSYAVAKPKDAEVRCTVDAYDHDFNILSKVEITVPRGTARLTGAKTLATPRRAVGARVHDCHRL
ncbi:DUF4307 domain-containing protein [Actinomadura flavalba]|uniref:DUF4307 domain-containing protein n=1 Tax=Actinomadura flavalba TaxID=1120938 RepID=UPI00036824B2|nr:DUF4307 domain-containing protein [Actinomadura flavalba]